MAVGFRAAPHRADYRGGPGRFQCTHHRIGLRQRPGPVQDACRLADWPVRPAAGSSDQFRRGVRGVVSYGLRGAGPYPPGLYHRVAAAGPAVA